MLQKYVLGFAFNKSLDKVVMIRKNRPQWQEGLFNGIGGKVEYGESYTDAMIREFEEETGVYVSEDRWSEFGTVEGPNYIIRAFRTVSDDILPVRTMTDESIRVMSVDSVLNDYPTVPNVPMLLQIALSVEFEKLYLTLEYSK